MPKQKANAREEYVSKAEAKVTKKKSGSEQITEFLALAHRRFRLAAEAEAKIRDKALEDLKFLVGDQWDSNIKQDRINNKKPCLTINRLGSIKKQVVNEQRAQRPSITVNPVGSDSDVDTAETLQGIFRHIEVNSDAEIAYDTAFEAMVAGGKGYAEVCTDYIPGQQNFQQEFYIKPVKNRFSVYCDPSSVDPCEADAYWKFQVDDMSHDEYRQKHATSKMASLTDFTAVGNEFPGWADSETIRVAKYWWKDCKETTLYQLADGSTVLKDDLPAGTKTVAERPYIQVTIYCSLINALEILNGTESDWRGDIFKGRVGYIPLVPVIGEDFDVQGERYQYGIVRDAKDPQKAYNIWKTAAAEVVSMAPKAPWVGWMGQFRDPKWATANTANHAYLEAATHNLKGEPYPSLPERNTFEPPVAALAQMALGADQDLKATTGIYEPSLGQNKTDQSGAAIEKLQKQGQLSNLNYTDNLSRFIRHIARIILDAMPFYYDTPRIQRIIKPDGTADQVIVHNGMAEAAQKLMTEQIQKVFDIGVGQYDVTISVGPSYQTKRQQAVAEQTDLVHAYPKLLDVAGDIVISNMDIPGARDIAARVKKTIPPNLLDDDGTDPKVQLAKAQSALQNAQTINQELMAHNAQMMDDIKSKKIENEGKFAIEKLKTETQILLAEITSKTQVSLAQIQAANDAWQGLHDAAHERGMQAEQHGQERALATQQQNADSASQQIDLAAQSGGANGGNNNGSTSTAAGAADD